MDAWHARSGVEGQGIQAAEPNWIRWGVPLVCVALSLLMTCPYAFRPMTVSFLGYDSAIFLWNCWWTKFALLDLGRSPFFCDYIYWPNGTSLALHSFALPYALVSIPFHSAIWNPHAAARETRFLRETWFLTARLLSPPSSAGVGKPPGTAA